MSGYATKRLDLSDALAHSIRNVTMRLRFGDIDSKRAQREVAELNVAYREARWELAEKSLSGYYAD